ncbi:MAG: ABC transporter substrate-binding protein [Acidimicrobiia bacterium]
MAGSLELGRREFLRLAALAGAGAALGGAACGSDSPERTTATTRAATKNRTLRIAQWAHFVPAYDTWFDGEYVKRWGEENDVAVTVDHISLPEVPSRAAAEAAAQRGHDIFGFLTSPAAFADSAIDHREIVEEVEAKTGRMVPIMEGSVLDPKSRRYVGFPEFWAPNPVTYRSDLWSAAGARPDTWDDVRAAGRRLKADGHPVGIGLSQDIDSTLSCVSLMFAYGASVQDESAAVTINRPATVEAVKVGVELFQQAMTDEVLSWEPASNNRFLAGGEGSMILNPVSALRAIEKQDPALAARVALLPTPAGPAGRHGGTLTGIYVVWEFAQNQELARRFLVDLALAYRDAVLKSELYNLPAFPGAVDDLAQLTSSDTVAQPADKYALLAGASDWSAQIGHPGWANSAIDEVFNTYILPAMFSAAVRGEATPEEAVAMAEARVTPIFDKWRERGKI